MNHVAVESSNVESVAHDPVSRTLEVRYRNGSVYQYQGVGADAHARLMAADSVGSHLHQHVKGKYAGMKVGG